MPKTILVVENNKEEWEFFRDLFELRGDKTVWIQDASKAEDTFLKQEFDLVLIEAIMPKVNGYDLCKTIKSFDRGKDTPVLLMGGLLGSTKFAHQAKTKYMADDVIVRPGTFEDLEEKLAFYLDGIKLDKPDSPIDMLQEDKAPPDRLIDFSKIRITIPFSGSLQDIPFPKIIAYFSFLGVDGTLTVERGKLVKNIFFSKGKPVTVVGLMRNQSLGQILLNTGRIDEEIFDSSIKTAIDTGKRLGEVLIEMDALTPHDLYKVIRKQAEDKILEIFEWEQGDYSFVPNSPDSVDELGIDINVAELILRGIRLHWDTAAIEKEFENRERMNVFPASGGYERAQNLLSTPQVRRLLNRITGKTTVKQLVEGSNMGYTPALQTLLALMILEAAVLGPPAGDDPKEEKRIYKELGPRLILDESEEGEAYRKGVEEMFEWITSTPMQQVFPFDGDSEKAKKDFDLKIHRLTGNKGLYLKTDDLTRAKVDFIRDRLTYALQSVTDPDNEPVDEQPVLPTREKTELLLESERQFRKGLYSLEKDDLASAKTHFAKAVELDDNTAEYQAYLGHVSYVTAENHDARLEAEKILEQAAETNPYIYHPHLFLGHIGRDKGDKEKAEFHYQKAYSLNSDCLEALRELRKIFLEQKLAQAVVSQTKPGEIMEFENMLNGLYQKMDKVDFFELLEADRESDYDTLKQNYFDLTAKYRPTDLIEQLDEVMKERVEEVFQRFTDAYSTLIAPEHRKEYEESLEFSQPSTTDLEVDPQDQEQAADFYELGLELMEKGEHKNASLQFRRAFEADPGRVEYLAFMAYAIYSAFKNSEDSHQPAMIKAKEMIRQAIGMNNECDMCHVLLGQIYFEEDKKLLADEQLELALRYAPENEQALRLFYSLYSKPQSKARARYLSTRAVQMEIMAAKVKKDFEKMSEMNFFEILDVPQDSGGDRVNEAYKNLSKKYKKLQAAPGAPEDMQARIEDILKLLSDAYMVLSDKQAQKDYIQDIAADSVKERFDIDSDDDHRKIYQKAQVMYKEGMYGQAEKAFAKASGLAPGHAQYQIWKGFSKFKADPDSMVVRDEAKEIIDKALDLDETNADAYWMLGKIFHYEGNEGQAIGLYKQALKINPKHHEAGLAMSLREQRQERRIDSRKKSLVESIKDIFSRKK